MDVPGVSYQCNCLECIKLVGDQEDLSTMEMDLWQESFIQPHEGFPSPQVVTGALNNFVTERVGHTFSWNGRIWKIAAYELAGMAYTRDSVKEKLMALPYRIQAAEESCTYQVLRRPMVTEALIRGGFIKKSSMAFRAHGDNYSHGRGVWPRRL
jgi:hypothetical protein